MVFLHLHHYQSMPQIGVRIPDSKYWWEKDSMKLCQSTTGTNMMATQYHPLCLQNFCGDTVRHMPLIPLQMW